MQGKTEKAIQECRTENEFQSTLPIQGETCSFLLCYYYNDISIHSPYTGRDNCFWLRTCCLSYFNPLSLYRERPYPLIRDCRSIYISIHSPYTGRDKELWQWQLAKELFQSTLPIQGETEFQVSRAFVDKFQSTLPIQGETLHLCYNVNSFYYFNPLSLYRERPGAWPGRRTRRHFNPLSLYRERPRLPNFFTYSATFQSTLPIQGETSRLWNHIIIFFISIHSPYTGRDSNFAHKTPNIQPISYAKRQTKELFPTPTQQIITSLALISSISRCESPCIFMCTSHSH